MLHGGVPLGIGRGSHLSNAILDKNVRIGCNVQVINKDRVQEADRSAQGFTIRSGIVVIEKNLTLVNGTIIQAEFLQNFDANLNSPVH